jgi:hypothetical protein
LVTIASNAPERWYVAGSTSSSEEANSYADSARDENACAERGERGGHTVIY